MNLKNGILKISIHNMCILSFIISLFLSPLVLLMYAVLLYLTYKEGVKGAIQSLIIITFRGVLSTAIGSNIGGYNVVKLLLILFLSFYIIYKSYIVNKDGRVKLISISLLMFSIYSMVASFISGSYPVSSSFKVILFFVTFLAILYGVIKTKNEIDWLNYIYKWFTYLMVISFLLLPFNRFRIINNNFQGVFNHVNVMGVMGALYISILLHKKNNSFNNKLIINILIIITLVMQYNTASRTGLIISCICLFVNFITNISIKKIICLGMALLFCMCVYKVDENIRTFISNEISSFIYKGNQNDILASRRDVQKNSQIKYENNELLGSGFMVPFEKEIKDYSLDMSIMYEPGNLVWMLLGDTGIIGIWLFLIFIFSLIMSGQVKSIILVMSSFGICMGEMVFFSVNNFSIIIYLILSIYITKLRKASM